MSDTTSVNQATIREWLKRQLSNYSLLDSLRGRRSRRFGWGMQIEHGPLAYESDYAPQPLTEDEEAALVFAASGITGYALADLSFGKGEGGSMLASLVGRTVPSPDALSASVLFVINDEATYYIRRPQNLTPDETTRLIELAQSAHDPASLVEIYRLMRVKLRDGRAEIPVIPGINFDINKWSLYAKGGTYFLPVNDLTGAMINVIIESFDPSMALYFMDERNWFQPAGIAKYAKSRGGHLSDDPRAGRVLPYFGVEMGIAEAVAAEQGMMLQNIGLMAQAMGLGGFVNFARAEFEWFEALGFRLHSMPMLAYGGATGLMVAISKLLYRDLIARYPVGLEHNGEVLLHAYCPPYYPTMTDAVHAWVEHKFGPKGVYRNTDETGWSDSAGVKKGIDQPDPKAVEAAAALCEYMYRRYGRFPMYRAPFATLVGYQATRVDVDFYDRFYKPEALSPTQRDYPGNTNE